MKGHIGDDRISKVAHGTDLLTPEELQHIEHCSDCLDAIAELIRERLRQGKRERPA